MDILVDFGKRIKQLRVKAGITQESLATLAELDRSYVGAIERGEKNVSLINIGKLANALDVDLSYLFEDDQFSPRSVLIKREQRKALEERFINDVDVMNNVISWRIAGPLSEPDVKHISQQIRSMALLLKKGEIKLLIDNRYMVIDGLAFVFSPEVNAVWEELQKWLMPLVQKVAVLCNSTLMKNQLDRLGSRSGIDKISEHIFEYEQTVAERKALSYLGLSENRLLKTKLGNNLI